MDIPLLLSPTGRVSEAFQSYQNTLMAQIELEESGRNASGVAPFPCTEEISISDTSFIQCLNEANYFGDILMGDMDLMFKVERCLLGS